MKLWSLALDQQHKVETHKNEVSYNAEFIKRGMSYGSQNFGGVDHFMFDQNLLICFWLFPFIYRRYRLPIDRYADLHAQFKKKKIN